MISVTRKFYEESEWIISTTAAVAIQIGKLFSKLADYEERTGLVFTDIEIHSEYELDDGDLGIQRQKYILTAYSEGEI